ncbi:putative ankyrin repeat protein [Mimivirus Bombay]|uniref:Putative ankyrin repeat protein R868 n=6 Tax=Mimivirus TaxID=315393 RepID=YR868_MIMIV|nr:putative ankyrin repeat protein [Acanthamoeba polyphaga mimivirus]Q5UP27.1 RecName: Full=Putative ankyrin repeat protein R868 [Acanthamoeba polyphaga mimivirus]AAV51126.1 unknown [Acanthamoeba polyphaga mimivirus]ADO18910.1 putative ankyrin repeat protein [Acanthamoeba polyphaga mimivirus]AMZ03306.1 putative ankyrin repeat protein [Mimivirus Bombay]
MSSNLYLKRMASKLYFKITNKDECHHGFQYEDGLNILDNEFNDNPKDSCVPGRLYFTEIHHMHKYLEFGIYLREVYLPIDNPSFRMIRDSSGDKYGANMIVLGIKRDLRDKKTWEYLVSKGINLYENNALNWASKYGFLEIVKLIMENKINCYFGKAKKAYQLAITYGHTDVVDFLKTYVNTNSDYNFVLRGNDMVIYFKC